MESSVAPPRTPFSEPNSKQVIPSSCNASGSSKAELTEGLRDVLITDLSALHDLSRVPPAIYPSAVRRALKQKASAGSIYCSDSEVVGERLEAEQ